jgi:hypothetical protein
VGAGQEQLAAAAGVTLVMAAVLAVLAVLAHPLDFNRSIVFRAAVAVLEDILAMVEMAVVVKPTLEELLVLAEAVVEDVQVLREVLLRLVPVAVLEHMAKAQMERLALTTLIMLALNKLKMEQAALVEPHPIQLIIFQQEVCLEAVAVPSLHSLTEAQHPLAAMG